MRFKNYILFLVILGFSNSTFAQSRLARERAEQAKMMRSPNFILSNYLLCLIRLLGGSSTYNQHLLEEKKEHARKTPEERKHIEEELLKQREKEYFEQLDKTTNGSESAEMYYRKSATKILRRELKNVIFGIAISAPSYLAAYSMYSLQNPSSLVEHAKTLGCSTAAVATIHVILYAIAKRYKKQLPRLWSAYRSLEGQANLPRDGYDWGMITLANGRLKATSLILASLCPALIIAGAKNMYRSL